MNKVLFSIIIPTYNSCTTLTKTLDSIKIQTIPKELVEVIIVDGGSTDNTLEIVKEYCFVKVIKNPNKLPEYAKMYGAQQATGKYMIRMDSDEEFDSSTTLEKRLKAFQQFPDAHLLVADKLYTPLELAKGYISSVYSSAIGDPFTYFMYRPKNGIIQTYQKNIVKRTKRMCEFEFKSEKRPIADGGTTTIDLDYAIKNNLIDFNSVSNISTISDRIMDLCPRCICIEDDNVIHNNRVSFNRFAEKIKFRIINNVMQTQDSGFSNRKISKNKKQYAFPFYSILIVFPIIDAILLSLRYKSLSFLLHPVYCLITTFYIGKYMLLKIFGKNLKNAEY